MSRMGVCITLLLLAGCTPGTAIVGSTTTSGGDRGMLSITTMTTSGVSSQPAAPEPTTPTSMSAPTASESQAIARQRHQRASAPG
jgi:hypothetical protein